MIKFYTSLHTPQFKFAGWVNWFLLVFLGAIFLFGIYAIYFILRLIFLKSFLLGLLFVFFGLPLLVRFVFLFLFSVFSSILSVLFLRDSHSDQPPTKAKDEVIDAKYKILD